MLSVYVYSSQAFVSFACRDSAVQMLTELRGSKEWVVAVPTLIQMQGQCIILDL